MEARPARTKRHDDKHHDDKHHDDEHRGDEHHNDSFRDLCMLYADFNRPVFLEQILRFVASYGASKAELSAIRAAVQKRTKQLAKRGKRGRPRAAESDAWMQKAITAAFRKHVLGWNWPRVTESIGMKPTKPNIRTVQRRERQFAEWIADSMPAESLETSITGGRYSMKLRDGALDSPRNRYWLRSKTGLPFDTRPEECKKIVETLLR